MIISMEKIYLDFGESAINVRYLIVFRSASILVQIHYFETH